MFFSADMTSLSARALSLLTNRLAMAVGGDWEGVMGLQRAVVSPKVPSMLLVQSGQLWKSIPFLRLDKFESG